MNRNKRINRDLIRQNRTPNFQRSLAVQKQIRLIKKKQNREEQTAGILDKIAEIIFKRRFDIMTWSKKTKERMWHARKNANHPHGKIKSLNQLAEEAGKGDK